MKTQPEYYIDLISRYLSGEATPEEIRELEGWVQSHPENRETFVAMKKAWDLSEHSSMAITPDIDGEWSRLQSLLHTPVSSIQHPVSVIRHPATRLLQLAAVFLLLLVPAFILYRYMSANNDVKIVAAKGLTECTLPDGTTITLNKGSVLHYPERFSKESRTVELDGEGWFEVAHDATKPFIVTAGNARVEVLGTTFSLNTHSYGNNREVVLASGKVKAYINNLPSSTVVLSPGEKAIIPVAGYTIRKMVNSDPNYLAWKTRHFEFDNTPLNEVAAVITKVYGISIRLGSDELGHCRITATFDHQELDAVLRVLEATLGVEISATGAGYVISGQGCR